MRLTGFKYGISYKFACLPIALLLVAGCSSSPSPIATIALVPAISPSPTAGATGLAIEVTRNIIYAAADDSQMELDVYAPIEPGPWPVVMAVHGVLQTRNTFVDLSEAISSEGAVVYNIDTSFSVPYLTGIELISCAVRFARATAADYGGDPDWIILVGNSAGGATGAVVALAGDDFKGDCVVTDSSAQVNAFVAFEAHYDYATTVGPARFDHSFLKAEDPELLDTINPYSYIGRNPDLQVRLVHGDAEDVASYDTPLESSIEFNQALSDAGYNTELIVLDGAPHTALTSKYLFPEGFALTVHEVMELARGSSQ